MVLLGAVRLCVGWTRAPFRLLTRQSWRSLLSVGEGDRVTAPAALKGISELLGPVCL
jgi:hypothetical protein